MNYLNITRLYLTILTLLFSQSVISQTKNGIRNSKPSNNIEKVASKPRINNYNKFDSVRDGTNIFFNQIKFDTILFKEMSAFINNLNQVNFVSGNLFFSEKGFLTPIAISFHANGKGIGNDRGLTEYFNRCVIGSKVTFDKCSIKNNDGTIIKSYSKSIFIK